MIVRCGSCLWQGTKDDMHVSHVYNPGIKDDGGDDIQGLKYRCPKCGQDSQLFDAETGEEIENYE